MNTTDRLTRGLLRIWMTVATIVYIIALIASAPYHDEGQFGQVLIFFPIVIHLGGGLAITAIIRIVKWIIEGFKD